MTGTFLLEIGTEEIPAGFAPGLIKAVRLTIEKKLAEYRVKHGTIRVMSTPRRLTCIVDDVLLKQEDHEQQVYGPPKKAAFDKDGNPTKAASGFARAHKVDVNNLRITDTGKGEVICVTKTIEGRHARDLFAEFLPSFITSLPFPKSMRWGYSTISFVRPIHWILALLHGEAINFELDGLHSSNVTYGHRFLAPGPLTINNESLYVQTLLDAHVIVDQQIRNEKLKQKIEDSAAGVGGFVLPDEKLLEENTNLVELPSTVCGHFDEKFLELPSQVLITSMREHQKYFAVIDHKKNLLPYFVAVNNTQARDPGIVRAGHERVLRARLEDARFFYNEDRKRSLSDIVETLKDVLFQAKLGTSYEKMERFRSLAASIAEKLRPEIVEDVKRCASLCKADLVTEMVGEFPSLQGTMGSVYAALSGENRNVARGIEQHYLPRFSGDRLPTEEVGTFVGIADRMDTIAGCFSIGLVPTGAADPYALRRHTLAIINILLEQKYDVDLREMIAMSLRLLGDRKERPEDEILKEIIEFFRVRLLGILSERGFSHDIISAVLALHINNIADAVNRIEALGRWKAQTDFETLAFSVKRVLNILKDQTPEGDVDSGIFQSPEEAKLFGAYETIVHDVDVAIEKKDYEEALSYIFSLKEPIDNFFDSVMVMDKDAQIRENRLILLHKLAILFRKFADFSKLEI